MRLASYLAVALLVAGASGLSQPLRAAPELDLINQAAGALGGMDTLMSIHSLKIYGYGQAAYQDGGGNIDSAPDAPQKWANINSYRRLIDLDHGRTNVRQHNSQNFVFAIRRLMNGDAVLNQSLDGEVAFDADGSGKLTRASALAARNRRIDMLDNPLSIIRTALAPGTKLTQLRREGTWNVVDLETAQGERLTLALDEHSHLPAWLSWVAPHPNFGDVTYRTYFTGYQRLNGDGPMLPSGYRTVSDFRGMIQQVIYVDKYEVNVALPDLLAPREIRDAAPPDPSRLPQVEAIPVAKGVWYLKVTPGGNSTLYEFADHLVLFEAYGSEANGLAVIRKARDTVPGKPLTHVILSHHHIDHTGGLRAAVSEGLTIVTNRENEAYIREVTSRPAVAFPDALGRSPRPLKIETVDQHLTLKDRTMTVEIYRVVNNSHYSSGLFAFAPRERLLSEGDLFDEGWDLYWWGSTYADTVKYWKLTVDRDLPVHGNINPYPAVQQMIHQKQANAQTYCSEAETSHMNVQGCPVVE